MSKRRHSGVLLLFQDLAIILLDTKMMWEPVVLACVSILLACKKYNSILKLDCNDVLAICLKNLNILPKWDKNWTCPPGMYIYTLYDTFSPTFVRISNISLRYMGWRRRRICNSFLGNTCCPVHIYNPILSLIAATKILHPLDNIRRFGFLADG